LNVKEFFLVLSSTGLAYRRCELVRINADEISANVQFVDLEAREALIWMNQPSDGLGSFWD
jgi:hypothetical protein